MCDTCSVDGVHTDFRPIRVRRQVVVRREWLISPASDSRVFDFSQAAGHSGASAVICYAGREKEKIRESSGSLAGDFFLKIERARSETGALLPETAEPAARETSPSTEGDSRPSAIPADKASSRSPVKEFRTSAAKASAQSSAKVGRAQPPKAAPTAAKDKGPASAAGTPRPPSGAPPGKLPHRPTSFVGREGEIAALSQLVLSSRLLTLTGPAGVGKSRLGLKIAEEIAAEFPDGAWFVELGSLSEPALVPNAVAETMSVRQERRQSVTESLINFLRNRRALIVLDNCEHLIGACAKLVDVFVSSASGVAIMATSQEPLSVAGERVWKVPPLEIPGPENAPERIAGYEAVRLFCERASDINSEFKLTAGTSRAVAEIARRLDGIPLAIELAAARVEMLSPEDIAGRLDERFRLLRGGGRTAMLRHRALEEALDWSYELCSDKEKVLLRRLSVFAGSFTLEAAEHVTSVKGLAAEDVFDLMARLVAKSFVASQIEGRRARYLLLETVREYAAERLAEAREEAEFRKRHAFWFSQFAESAEERLTGPDQREWLNLVGAEHDNLRSAIALLIAERDQQAALRLATALTMFWRVRGHFSEGRKWLEEAMAAGKPAPLELRAKALWAAGLFAALLSDAAPVTALASEALEAFRSLGDERGIARALNVLGLALVVKEQPAQAVPHLKEAISLAGQARDDWCLSDSLARLGYANIRLGDSDTARECFQQCLHVARASGDTQTLVYGLIGLGWAAMAAGNFSEADTHMAEALELANELQQSLELGEALIFLGESARVQGHSERAREYLSRSEGLARSNGSSVLLGRSLSGLGRIATASGDLPVAIACFEEVVRVAREAELHRMLGRGLVGLATAHRGEGRLDEAATMLDDALRVADQAGDDIGTAAGLLQLSNLHRQRKEYQAAAQAVQKALALLGDREDRAGIHEYLDAVAGLYARQGRADQACRIFAAAAAMRQKQGLVFQGLPLDRDQAAADLEYVRKALSAQEFEEAWRQGSLLSIEEAVSYASRGRGSRQRPPFGWASLTPAETDVIKLLKEGLTNPEIAERLFISPRTVGGHLGHIFTKLGLKTRQELREEAKRRL